MGFGEQLKARREALCLSRSELAGALGLTASAISNYENGVSFPKQELLLRLFDALRTDPNFLFAGSFRSPALLRVAGEDELLEQYRALSSLGRETLLHIAQTLGEYQDALGAAPDEEAETRCIPLYRTPAAAGYASPALGEDFDYLECDATVPRGAEFAVRIQGDSMEPHIHDGSIVYVSHDPLQSGDVGIFCVDGDMLCKQYHRDGLGVTYLFSLNRARADADVVFGPGSGRSLVCFGRVLLPHRPALPGD